MIAGWTDTKGDGHYDFYLVKTDATGDIIWENTLKNSTFNSEFSIQQAGENNYIITGWWEEPIKKQNVRNDKCQIYTAVVGIKEP